MATTTSGIQELYSDIVADLVPYFENQVLLPNPEFIMNYFNIAGSAGNTVKVPVTNSWSAGTAVSENASISANGTNGDFNPTSVNITLAKYAAFSDVTEESLEDGGMALVRNQVVTRLSRALAQAVDVAGFAELTDAVVQPTDGTTSHGGNDGATSAGTYKCNLVMSPEALGYAIKREPTVQVWFDPDKDAHQFRATIRCGFKSIYRDFVRGVYASGTVGSSAATLAMFQKAVAKLRAANAPTMANGLYVAVVDPATEYAIAAQLNSVTQGTIGDLSAIGNEALRSGALGVAAGCLFVRSNNLANATISA